MRPPKHIILAAAGILLMCSPPPRARAQEHDLILHPENWTEVQDQVYIRTRRPDGTTRNDSSIISAAYRFEYVYDSTCRGQYLFSECMHNGSRPRLLAWMDGHIHSSDEAMMTDSSRTASFPIAPGDMVRFYREFKWYDPKLGRQDTNNFRSLDTVDYAVELARATTGERIALLDSFGVLPSPIAGSPIFYGTRPIMSRISYRVPVEVGHDSAFVRVRLYSRGEGPYLPIRKDDITFGLSHALDRGLFDYYLSLFGGALNKRSVEDLTTRISRGGSLLAVSPMASGRIEIHVAALLEHEPVEIAIYDAGGACVSVPYAGMPAAGGTVTADLGAAGVYFVALLRGGRILDVATITTAR